MGEPIEILLKEFLILWVNLFGSWCVKGPNTPTTVAVMVGILVINLATGSYFNTIAICHIAYVHA